MVVWMSLWGCAPAPVVTESPASLIASPPPERVEVVAHQGSAPLQTHVRQVNAYGVATGGVNPVVTVEGRPVEVAMDGLGYGVLSVSTVGLIDVVGAEMTGHLHVLPRYWEGLPLSPVHPPAIENPTLVASLGDAILVSTGSELWWVPPAGPPHRVLEADAPLMGVRGVDVDVDGARDAVAWTSQRVFLLRGRLQGGLSWGAAWEAVGLSVGGVDVGDLSGDNLPDVAIAWSDVDGGVLDVWEGDGLWGFAAGEPRPLSQPPVDVSVGDNTGEGRAQLTVVQMDGSWSRFVDGGGGRYIQVGPLRPKGVAVPDGARAFSGADMDGNDADELVLMGPRDEEGLQDVFLFDFFRGLEVLTRTYVEPHFALGDGDGDGSADLWFAVSGGKLGSLRFDRTSIETGVYRELEETARLPEHGPIVVDAFLGQDVYGDLALLGERFWWWLRGTSTEHRPGYADAPDGDFWLLDTQPMEAVAEGFAPMILGQKAEDGRSGDSLFAARTVAGGLDLQHLGWDAEKGALNLWARQSLGDDGYTVVDAARCGDQVWVLGGDQLQMFELEASDVLEFRGDVSTPGTRVACGEGPDGAAALVVEEGEVRLFDDALGAVGEISVLGVVDATFVDLGEGPAVETCTDEGCSVLPWSKPGAGPGWVVSSRRVAEWVDAEGEVTSLKGGGTPLAVDMDLDAQVDLLMVESDPEVGTLLVFHRGTDGGLANPEAYMTPLHLEERAMVLIDLDGVGPKELWAVDHEGILYRSGAADGADPTTESTPQDTGLPVDTGLPEDTGMSEDTGV